jgi:hypothetical protein
MTTNELTDRLEELLEAEGVEDADDWGPDQKGPLKWAKEIEKKDPRVALAHLVEFIHELTSVGIQQEAARRIIGEGKRTVNMMKSLLDINTTLVAEGHGGSAHEIVTNTTSVQEAKKKSAMLLNPPSNLEERPAKRERKQAERDPGCVDSTTSGLSCAFHLPVCLSPPCSARLLESHALD